MWCFFFFQAEDGIRDIGVTGVQTCALPISLCAATSRTRSERLVTGPADDRPDATSVLLPGPWTHRDISCNGVRLHAAEAGSGPLVLLLHGFPQFWWTWRSQLTSLADAGFHVVAPDLRGYGASDKPPRGYDLPTLSADVAALVRALGEQDAVVVEIG